MSKEITKAEIKPNLSLKYSYEEAAPDRHDKVSVNSSAVIHNDLYQAFQNLLPHLLMLTEMKHKIDVVPSFDLGNEMPPEVTRKYKVTSFKVEYKNDIKYITIEGFKVLSHSRTMKFCTPSTTRGTGNYEYEFWDHLMRVMDLLHAEIIEYIDGKYAELTQEEMKFDEFESEEAA